MTISKNKVVSFHYKLTDDHGVVLDSSEGRDAFSYLHGSQMIVPGLEQQLEGKEKGAKFNAVVAPEQGYGAFNQELLQRVPRANFGEQEVEVGMQFQVGESTVVTVQEVTEEDVLVNGNHPLAGVTLNFAVEVTDVREATPEETAHGHVHGPDGHPH